MSTVNGTRMRRTTSGATGFRTSKVSLRLSDDQTPPVASARAYLRRNLPAIYQEGDFGLRFVGALETLLDPIVGTLDVLPRYFHPDLAPSDVLELLAAWFGLAVDESWPDERRRQALRLAAELGRRRGTKSGLELALAVAFPDLPLRVEDGGKVTWTTAADDPAEPAESSFTVYCDAPLTEAQQAAVARAIEHSKPVHIGYRLRVRTSKRRTDGAAT
jgi:phage tail-like protein